MLTPVEALPSQASAPAFLRFAENRAILTSLDPRRSEFPIMTTARHSGAHLKQQLLAIRNM